MRPSSKVVPASDRAAAEQMLRDGEIEAIVVPGSGATGVTVIGYDSVPSVRRRVP